MADLAWLLQSPPLLNTKPQRFTAGVQNFSHADAEHIAQWLNQLDAASLHAFVAQALPSKAPMRLGRYAERLMEYFLQESGLYELVAANVPLRRATSDGIQKTHTTIGEFDYLIKDANATALHWELAVKFYLCHPTQLHAEPHDFKGPAGKDTLGLKLGKVFDKQLRHLPPPPYEDTHWHPEAYARGWMFYPRDTDLVKCDVLHQEHLQGWWMTHQAFKTAQFEYTHFVHLPRLHWLAPYAMNELAVMSHIDIANYLDDYWLAADPKQSTAGQMVACVEYDGNCWRERSRGFVLPEPLQQSH